MFLSGSAISLFVLGACRQTSNDGHSESAVDETVPAQTSAAMPAANPLRNAYFGETHIHTSFSPDTYLGGTRLKPDDAYRYAEGESVSLGGQALVRNRPLDFAAVVIARAIDYISW